MMAWVYILQCADGSLYTGITRGSLEQRVAEHQSGHYGGYTSLRRPVRLIWAQDFRVITDAIACERQVKRWSRAKKLALVAGDFQALRRLARGRGRPVEDV
jgi:putative endonuclease